jgi:hypothetical protein
VPNPGISGFQPDKRQMSRTLLVCPGHRRLRHQKVRAACARRSAQIDEQAAWREGNLRGLS